MSSPAQTGTSEVLCESSVSALNLCRDADFVFLQN